MAPEDEAEPGERPVLGSPDGKASEPAESAAPTQGAGIPHGSVSSQLELEGEEGAQSRASVERDPG